jgi:hypothetical protein
VPCCAFAAFIVGQILIGFDALKRRFFWTSTTAGVDNPATMWRLNAPAPTLAATPRRFNPRWIAAVALIELVLVAAGAYGLRTHLGHSAHHDHAVMARIR